MLTSGNTKKPTISIIPAAKASTIVPLPIRTTPNLTIAPMNRDTRFIIQTLNLRSRERLLESISSLFHGRNKVFNKRSMEKKSKNLPIIFKVILKISVGTTFIHHKTKAKTIGDSRKLFTPRLEASCPFIHPP
jgi:hypothetical protein